MRTVLCISTAAVVTAIAAAGVGSGGTDIRIPAIPAVPAGTGYLFKVEFGLLYEVEWVEEQGDRYGACQSWHIDRGKTEVNAGSAAFKKRGPDRLAGRLQVFDDYSRDPTTGGWARGSAVGGARATVHRTLVQAGGTTACGDTGPTTEPRKPNDCGTRSYTTAQATMRAEMRRGYRYLDWATMPVLPGSQDANSAAFSITVPGRALYLTCLTTPHANELPMNIPLRLKGPDVRQLRKLQPGGKYIVKDGWQGPCTEHLGQQSVCRFHISLNLEFQRWKVGMPYP